MEFKSWLCEVFFHVTKKGIGDIIRRDGFKPGPTGELGPGIYLAKHRALFPTHLRRLGSGETYETETLRVHVNPSVKFFLLNSEAPNPPLEIYKKLFPKDYAKRYDMDSAGGKIWYPNLKVNWTYLHQLLKDRGYGAIERTER